MMQRLMLNKEMLLEMIQNFVIFDKDDDGKTIKKIVMQHQYFGIKAAVKKNN